MLALLLASEREDAPEHHDSRSGYLTRLGDRPFLQHIVESLVIRGVTRFEFVFHDSCAAAAEYFGDGSRWGSQFNFHLLSKAGVKPLLRVLAADAEGTILLGRTDRFPAFGSQELTPWGDLKQSVFFTEKNQEEKEEDSCGKDLWTGWAVFPSHREFSTHLAANPAAAWSADLKQMDLGDACGRIRIGHAFSVRSGQAVLQSQRDLLSGSFPDLQTGGRQVRPGVWMGRNVYLHSTARIIAPVYLGANTRIGANAQVGPFTVVAEDCIIGADSTACHSLINPGTYVGESLEIHQSIVDHEQIMDVKSGTFYRMTDQFLLGSLVRPRRQIFRFLCDRIAAALLLLVFSPILAILFFNQSRSAGALVRDRAIRIPSRRQQHDWPSFPIYRFQLAEGSNLDCASHFLSVFLPGLISVLRGDLSLVGVRPRTAGEVEVLPEDWQALYLRTKAGLITDAVVHFEMHLTEDELRASECYYSATESFSSDLRLLGLYLRKLAKAAIEQEQPLS